MIDAVIILHQSKHLFYELFFFDDVVALQIRQIRAVVISFIFWQISLMWTRPHQPFTPPHQPALAFKRGWSNVSLQVIFGDIT